MIINHPLRVTNGITITNATTTHQSPPPSYNNCIEVMSSELGSVPTLRVLMLGKNRIRVIQVKLCFAPTAMVISSRFARHLTYSASFIFSGTTVTISPTHHPVIIQNLDLLTKLDVLDLHSNLITKVEALDSLTELRVLNLAGNIHLRLR